MKDVEKKVVLPLRFVTLRGITSNARGKSKAILENVLEESRKKKKDRQEFRLVDKFDVEEIDLVSEEEDKK